MRPYARGIRLVLDILETALAQASGRRARLAAVAREADDLVELVRRRQALPPSRRTNFLQEAGGPRASAL